MKLTDTHCHILNDSTKYTQTPDQIIEEWKSKNGELLLAIGTHVQDSKQIVDIVKKHKDTYAIVGIHPEYADTTTEQDIKEIRDLSEHSIGIGEIGLDYFYTKENKQKQMQIFEAQMQIAQEKKLPVCIHSREAMQDTLEVLKKFPSVKGVVHCFSGSTESAQQIIDLGYMIGVGGVITFKNGIKLAQVVKKIGIEHIVLETDSPYLAPEPHRGEVNKPAYVELIAYKVAEILDMSFEDVLKETNKNAKNIYNLQK